MPGFDDQTEGAWPLEVQGKLNDWRSHKNTVGTQNRSDMFAECALMSGVDGGLVVFETNTEFGLTMAGAFAVGGPKALTAMSF